MAIEKQAKQNPQGNAAPGLCSCTTLGVAGPVYPTPMPDYSAQWVKFYRDLGDIKEAEKIEAISKKNKSCCQPIGGFPQPQH